MKSSLLNALDSLPILPEERADRRPDVPAPPGRSEPSPGLEYSVEWQVCEQPSGPGLIG